ncbi:IS110 family transposase [Draconibacterium orientale]|uniref:IS110 family transposase n=1 Tax=Draconibacterium orientale TaxID=1168034 RepID=UPI002A0A3FF7|nr:IS110 family transposase [Draconibacterium orientale]
MQGKVKTISFQGQNIYIGIDAHLKNWTVTVMTENSLTKTISQNPDAGTLYTYLQRTFPGGNYLSAYEAGFCGFSAHRNLEKYGIKSIVVNPADIPTTDKERKQKEDRRDSRKIARSLKNGELTGIHVPDKETEELRSLVRYRKTLVKEISRHKSRIKSHLHCFGIAIPGPLAQASTYWSGKFTQWLEEVQQSTPYGGMVLQSTLATVKHLRAELLKINRKLRELEKEVMYSFKIKLLRSIPGIGLIVAVTLLSELETILRFKNLDKLCSFVGLVPITNTSGENDKTGKITSRSNKPLRGIIIEAAWIASRNDPALAQCYLELCKRMKPNKAIIKIAKKLLNRIRYVMKNEKEYVHSVVQ